MSRAAMCRLGWALLMVGAVAGCAADGTSPGAPASVTDAARPAGSVMPRASDETEARRRARIRLELASNYYQQGNYNVALEELRRTLELDPGYAAAYGVLGLVYRDLGDYARAEESFQRGLRLAPDDPELNNNYGWFLCQTGRERESLQYFDRALRDPLYTTPARAGQNAGSCLIRLKDYAGAERYLRRSFELDASSPVTKYLLARTYLVTGQVDRATFYYNLLARSVESTPETLWLGLRIARANGDLRTESQLANELRERFPRSPEVAALARGDFND